MRACGAVFHVVRPRGFASKRPRSRLLRRAVQVSNHSIMSLTLTAFSLQLRRPLLAMLASPAETLRAITQQ